MKKPILYILLALFIIALSSCKKKVTTTITTGEEELLSTGEVLLNSFESLDDLYLIKPSSTNYSTASRLDISPDWYSEGSSSLKVTYFDGNTQFIMLLKSATINNIDVKSIKSLSIDYYYPGNNEITIKTGFARKGSEMFNAKTETLSVKKEGTTVNEINGLIIESNEADFVGFKFEIEGLEKNETIYFDNLRITLGNELTLEDKTIKTKIENVIDEIKKLDIISTDDYKDLEKVDKLINDIPLEYRQAIYNYNDYSKSVKKYLSLSSGTISEKQKLFYFDSFLGLAQIKESQKSGQTFTISNDYTFEGEYDKALKIDYSGYQWNYMMFELPFTINDYDYIKVSLYNESDSEKAVFFTWNQRYDILPYERVDVTISVSELKIPMELEVTDLTLGNTSPTYGSLYLSPIYVYSAGYDIYMDSIDKLSYESTNMSMVQGENGLIYLKQKTEGTSDIAFTKNAEFISNNEEVLFIIDSPYETEFKLIGENDHIIKGITLNKGLNAITLNNKEFNDIVSYRVVLGENDKLGFGYSIIYRTETKDISRSFALCSLYMDLENLSSNDFDDLTKYLSSFDSMSKYELNVFRSNRENEYNLIETLKEKTSELKINLVNEIIDSVLEKSVLSYHDLDIMLYINELYDNLTDSEKLKVKSYNDILLKMSELSIYKPVLTPTNNNLKVAKTWTTEAEIETIYDSSYGRMWHVYNVNQVGAQKGAIEFEFKNIDIEGTTKVYFSVFVPNGLSGIFYVSLNSWRNNVVYELEIAGPNVYEIAIDSVNLSKDGFLEIYSDLILDGFKISSIYGLKEDYIINEIIEAIGNLPSLSEMNPYKVSGVYEVYKKTLELSDDTILKITNYSRLEELLPYISEYVSILPSTLSHISREDSWSTTCDISIRNDESYGDCFYFTNFEKTGDYTGAIEFRLTGLDKGDALKTGFSFFAPNGQTGTFYVSTKNWRQTPIYEKNIEGGKWINVSLDSIDVTETLYIAVYTNDYTDGWMITSLYGKLSDDELRDSFESLNEDASINGFYNFLNLLNEKGNDSVKNEYMNSGIVKSLLNKFKGENGTLITELVNKVIVEGEYTHKWDNAIVPQGVYQVYKDDASELVENIAQITLPRIDFSLFSSVKFILFLDSDPVSTNGFSAYGKTLVNGVTNKRFLIEIESNETESILYIHVDGEVKGEGVKLSSLVRSGKESLTIEFKTNTKYLWFTLSSVDNEGVSDLKATLR